MITEPDVTLTDYALAVECALFTHLLLRTGGHKGPLRVWFALFFAATGLAALAGGTVHGFFLDEQTMGHRILWRVTLIAIGITALASWSIGARMQFSETVARWITFVAVVEFAGYSAVVLFVGQTFAIAVANYLPAAIFLLIAFAFLYRRTASQRKRVRLGLFGLLLIFIGAGVQQAEIALHPRYFNHNALYHLIQGVALFLIFLAARRLTKMKS